MKDAERGISCVFVNRCRTNNSLGTFHCTVMRKIGTAHPNVSKFWLAVGEIHKKVVLKFNQNNHMSTRRMLKSNLHEDVYLRATSEACKAGRTDAIDFLENNAKGLGMQAMQTCLNLHEHYVFESPDEGGRLRQEKSLDPDMITDQENAQVDLLMWRNRVKVPSALLLALGSRVWRTISTNH